MEVIIYSIFTSMEAMWSMEAGEWNGSQGTLEELKVCFHQTRAWKLWWKFVEASISTNCWSFHVLSWE